MPTSENQARTLTEYYRRFHQSYRDWGENPNQPGIYALHFGFNENQDGSNHQEAIRTTGLELIKEGKFNNGDLVLDAGCGTGVIAFELSSRFPQSSIYGINISVDQLITANVYRKMSGAINVSLILQDYLSLGFKNGVFDKVLFCESLCHADDKGVLLNEAVRVLKPDGMIVIADAFTFEEDLTDDKKKLFQQFMDGWHIPSLDSIDTFVSRMTEAGFDSVCINDMTNAVATSMRLSGNYEQMRLLQDPDADIERQIGRLGNIATRDLIMNHTLGYFFITGSKTQE